MRGDSRVVQKGAVGSGKRVKTSELLSRVRAMVHDSGDARATALANLQESELGDPFRILIGTILSQRTRDENTTRAVENLFSRYRNVRELAAADPRVVRRLIKPAGFYNMKTAGIIRVSRQLISEFGGRVPDNVDDL